MNCTLRVLTLLATLTLAASAAEISGTWKLRVTRGVIHKTFADVTLELKAEGSTLTGTAHIGENIYPGTAPVSEGRIEGDSVSFTVVGRTPSSNGTPVMTFHGIIRGEHLELIMHMISGPVDSGDTQLAGDRLN